MRAWGYYGIPRGAQVAIGSKAPSQAVGEVRYIVGWAADQMVRMGWRITIDDRESWRISLPDGGGTVVSDADQDDPSAPDHPANASRRLLEAVGWNDRTARQVTTNLFVAGEHYYVSETKGGETSWSVVSMIDPDLEKRVNKAALKVHGLWPHPGDPGSPDAPLFGVLAVLDDMLWLTRLERSQSANRVAMRGIIGIADNMQMAAGGTVEQFWADFEAALSRSMDDPEDVSPVGLRGPQELVEPVAGGMRGLSWLIPEFPYDERIDERMKVLIQRLAYGLPVPPEILLGLQASSRATAFQVEGNAYRAHIEPMAWTVAQTPEDALIALLPDVGRVRVVPDPSAILARRHTVEDVFQAFDRGAVGFEYLREVTGIPERAALTDADVALRAAWTGRLLEAAAGAGAVPDEIENADAEPAIAAAVPLPDGEGVDQAPVDETAAAVELATRLARIDDLLLAELTGAAERTVATARTRLGAAVRSKPDLRANTPEDLSNDEIALQLGAAALTELGVDVERSVAAAVDPAVRWWEKRLAAAVAEVSALLAAVGADEPLDASLAAESVRLLEQVLTRSVFETAVDAQALREVISLAGS